MDRTRLESYFKDGETVDIAEMYQKFGFTVNMRGTILPRHILMSRAEFLQEELDELKEAIESGDLLNQIDALIDLVVVAKGTAAMMGLRWKYHWDEVHRANMMKQPGNREKRPNLSEDLIKPPGWYGPDHLQIIEKHGRTG